MKTIELFENFGEGSKRDPAKTFKYIEAAGSQTERLLIEDRKNFLYVKQGGPAGQQIYVDAEQAKELIDLLKKFIEG